MAAKNLLPITCEEFRSKEYWDEFFRKRTDAFEWYGEYGELCGVIHKYSKPSEKVLMIGCGNSQLSEDLYDVGYRQLVNIDISDVVIRQMKERNREVRAEMEFVKMDMLKMDFNAGHFNVVIDKGTLDAIFTDTSTKVVNDVNQMFKEIARVLRVGGRYICITLVQEHILDKIMDHFTKGWFVRVHRILASSDGKPASPLPVFAFVFTKTKFAEGTDNPAKGIQLLEMCLGDTDQVQRVTCAEDIKTAVKELQQYAIVKQQIGKMHPGESFTLELWATEGANVIAEEQESITTHEPRYTLSVLDILHVKAKNGKFAIFIVPQGRETEWHFASKEGQKQLADDAAFERLVVVSLSRRHTYSGMDAIKEELSGKVMELAPTGVSHKTQIPFLSVGDDVGSRNIVHEGHSMLSGGFVVEEVIGDRGQKFRRLIFLKNRTAIQSEVRIVPGPPQQAGGKSKNKKKKNKPATKSETVDLSYLACSHHRVMLNGLALVKGFVDSGECKKALLIGLGGGGLPMFMHRYFPQLTLHVVELDPSVVDIAQDWFGFVKDERMTVAVSDGLDFVTVESKKDPRPSYDVIMFDIDSKDTGEGVISPPTAFVEKQFLASVKSILSSSGVFVLNLGCRNSERREVLLKDIKTVFPELYTLDIEEDVNEVIFCLPQIRWRKEESPYFKEVKCSFQKSAKNLEKIAKEHAKGQWDSTLDLCESLENLKLFDK